MCGIHFIARLKSKSVKSSEILARDITAVQFAAFFVLYLILVVSYKRCRLP